MRQLPAVKDGLISALLYAMPLLLPLTHCNVGPGHIKYRPTMSGFHFWLFLQPSSDNADPDVGSKALSALPPVPHFLLEELFGGH